MNPQNLENPQYLGDGVYISYDKQANGLVLTTTSHLLQEADNIIFLEEPVVQALLNYIKKCKE